MIDEFNRFKKNEYRDDNEFEKLICNIEKINDE